MTVWTGFTVILATTNVGEITYCPLALLIPPTSLLFHRQPFVTTLFIFS